MPRPSRTPAVVTESDEQLWKRIQGGDEQAFECLFRRHAGALCDFAGSLTGDDDAAQDIVHELFCWIWEHRFALESPRSVRGYLFTSARNRSWNHLRSNRVSRAFLERLGRVDPVPEPSPDAHVIGQAFRDAIVREVAQLPPRCRDVFALVRYQGLSQAEAAEELGMARKTVEIHVGRALRTLRERLAHWMPGKVE